MDILTQDQVSELQILESVYVDLVYPNDKDYARANQYNKGTWFLEVNITERGEIWDIPTNAVAVIGGTKPDKKNFFNSVLGTYDNKIYLPLTEQMLMKDGVVKAQIDFYYSDKKITFDEYGFVEDSNYENFKFLSTVNFPIMVMKSAYDKDNIESSNEYRELTKVLYDIQHAKDTAITADKLSKEVLEELEKIKEALKNIISDATGNGAIIDDETPSLSRVYSSQHCEDIFVRKRAGYDLSQNNYTNAEKSKLADIEENANNYRHPDYHPASMIISDEVNRFVTQELLDKLKVAYTNDEIQTMIEGQLTDIVWKSAVPTYEDVLIVYPNPENGWRVSTDEGDYYYNGTEWIKVSNSAIAIATTTVKGLMSPQMVVKLNSIEDGAQENRIEKILLNNVTVPIDKKTVNLALDNYYIRKKNNYDLMSQDERNKLAGIESKAEVNAIETIFVNGVEQTIDSTDRSVRINLADVGGLTQGQIDALNCLEASVDYSTGYKELNIGEFRSIVYPDGTKKVTIDGINFDTVGTKKIIGDITTNVNGINASIMVGGQKLTQLLFAEGAYTDSEFDVLFNSLEF